MKRTAWALISVTAVAVALYAIANAFVPRVRPAFVEALFAEKALRALGHLSAGGIALATGVLQFSARLRMRRPRLHRSLGKVYVITVLVSGLSAIALAPSSTGGVAAHFGFGVLGVLWVGSSLAALVFVRARNFVAHREWMIRSYALCLAAVTLRIYLPLSQVMGIPFSEAYPAIAWLCWVPNLVVAEWFVLRSSLAPLTPAV